MIYNIYHIESIYLSICYKMTRKRKYPSRKMKEIKKQITKD